MITGESDGNETNVLLAQFGQSGNSVRGLRSLPCLWSDLRLPRQSPPENPSASSYRPVRGSLRVGEAKLCHDGMDCSCDFGSVWISSADTESACNEISLREAHLTISSGSEWAENKMTTSSRRSFGYFSRAALMLCETACKASQSGYAIHPEL